MLEASKSVWFETFFSLYNRNLLKRRFNSLRVSGLENLTGINAEFPKIIYANHSGWWDGLVAFQISRKLKMDSFVMMEERQLEKLFLFRKLGAFSVIREKPFEAIKSINYAANLLVENPHRTLWIFPQGKILPNDFRPIKFYGGISKIIQKVGCCSTLGVALRYEFLGSYKPEIFLKIGKPTFFRRPENFDKKKQTKILENNLTDLLEQVKEDVLISNFNHYENII